MHVIIEISWSAKLLLNLQVQLALVYKNHICFTMFFLSFLRLYSGGINNA